MTNLKNEIKSLIVKRGYTVSSLANLLTEKGYPTSKQNLNNKINRGSLRYEEILQIADVLGYEIIWKEKS